MNGFEFFALGALCGSVTALRFASAYERARHQRMAVIVWPDAREADASFNALGDVSDQQAEHRP